MNNIKKPFAIILALFLLILSACSSNNEVENDNKVETAEKVVTSSGETIKNTRVIFEVENYGNIVVETYPQYAPETVEHFLNLVKMGYYDGVSIDKINPGFSMEISSETVLSSGEYTDTVTGEFAKNGYSNDLELTRGTLAMCYLPGEYDSATTRFMIILDENPEINGMYAGFAKIVDGVPVFEQISKLGINGDGSPLSPIVMKKVYIAD